VAVSSPFWFVIQAWEVRMCKYLTFVTRETTAIHISEPQIGPIAPW
jgi:hypothetical protein